MTSFPENAAICTTDTDPKIIERLKAAGVPVVMMPRTPECSSLGNCPQAGCPLCDPDGATAPS